jgi:undecaprenyl diphosphate synthase
MEVAEGTLRVEDVDAHRMRKRLSTSDLPDPDLLIRTGGEQRLSDFLLFEAADAELYFTDTLWPEFDEKALDRALADYAGRERRFGRTPAQVRAGLDLGKAGRAAPGLT